MWYLILLILGFLIGFLVGSLFSVKRLIYQLLDFHEFLDFKKKLPSLRRKTRFGDNVALAERRKHTPHIRDWEDRKIRPAKRGIYRQQPYEVIIYKLKDPLVRDFLFFCLEKFSLARASVIRFWYTKIK